MYLEIKGKASPGQLRKNFAQHRPGSFNKGSNNVVDEKSLQISTSSIKTSSPPPLQQHFLSPNQSSTDGNTTVHANVLDLGQFFKSHVLFASASNEFIADFTKKMHLRHFLPGDSIIRENEIGRAMFFVIKGVVTVASKDGESIYADLGAGKFFGGTFL